jgi:inositol polyphosphate-4-phosphatase
MFCFCLGCRIICCKSAKDRTAMAITWEQSRILYEEHGLSESTYQLSMNLMRSEGVRRFNVFKNTGQSSYAFNLIQRNLLPTVYRPPESACGNVEG